MTRIFLILLIHILGDFFLQGERLRKKKAYTIKSLLFHTFIYISVFIISCPFLLGMTFKQALLYSFINGFTHLIVDFYFRKLKIGYANFDQNKYRVVLFLDQFLHILILYVSYMLLFPGGFNVEYFN
jgi:hypothetical protein